MFKLEELCNLAIPKLLIIRDIRIGLANRIFQIGVMFYLIFNIYEVDILTRDTALHACGLGAKDIYIYIYPLRTPIGRRIKGRLIMKVSYKIIYAYYRHIL